VLRLSARQEALSAKARDLLADPTVELHASAISACRARD
jgi:hypothetical protein